MLSGKFILSYRKVNFGAIDEIVEMAKDVGFSIKEIDSVPREGNPEIVFYAYMLQKN